MCALLQAVPTLEALSLDGCRAITNRSLVDIARLSSSAQRPLRVSALREQDPEQWIAGGGGGGGGGSDAPNLPAVDENLGDLGSPVPPPLDVSCSICGEVLWRGLAEYTLHCGQQGHIESEIATNTPRRSPPRV